VIFNRSAGSVSFSQWPRFRPLLPRSAEALDRFTACFPSSGIGDYFRFQLHRGISHPADPLPRPGLRDCPGHCRPADVVSPLERITLNDLHRPGRAGELADRFPSHLHIDLLPRIQGRGTGRQLMAAAISSLRERGSRGLHLMAARGNERAAGFYRHLGFGELPHSYLRIFTMDLR
jgi:GNAT superfamily N-acetyltransferase